MCVWKKKLMYRGILKQKFQIVRIEQTECATCVGRGRGTLQCQILGEILHYLNNY